MTEVQNLIDLAVDRATLPGESVGTIFGEHPGAAVKDEERNYYVYPVTDANGKTGDSVFLVMPEAGSNVEPVRIVENIELNVTAVLGSGLLVKTRAASKRVRTQRLRAGTEGASTRLQIGDEYSWFNDTSQPFVVRDDCLPTFKSDDEDPSKHPRLLAKLAELAASYAQSSAT